MDNKCTKYNPRQSGSTAEEKFCLFVKLLIYESVVFFKLEYFISMLAEVSCDLQGDYCRWHITACLNEVDRLSRYSDSLGELLLGYILDGPFDLYTILHSAPS